LSHFHGATEAIERAKGQMAVDDQVLDVHHLEAIIHQLMLDFA
jgi:hypothetical protein